MVVLCDTRQQAGKHKNIDDYLDKRGIKRNRQALYVGDYMLANDGSVSVDTKQDVRELAMDVFQDHDRFVRECVRARDAGITLYVLTEEKLPGGRLDRWEPPQGCRVDPARLRQALITLTGEYGVQFRFCDGRSTGKKLMELLTTRERW